MCRVLDRFQKSGAGQKRAKVATLPLGPGERQFLLGWVVGFGSSLEEKIKKSVRFSFVLTSNID